MSKFLPVRAWHHPKFNVYRMTGLLNVLRAIECVLSEQELSDWQIKALAPIIKECHNILIKIGKVVDENYLLKPSTAHGFRDKSQRVWKRLTWDPDDIQVLRLRVILSIGLLNAFNGSLIRYQPNLLIKHCR